MFIHRFYPPPGGDTVPRRRKVRLLAFSLLLLLGAGLALSMVLSNVTRSHASAPRLVSKSWYFAEGRVGAGFQEYLTLSNPDASLDCSAQITYLPEGSVSATPHTLKPLLVKSVSIVHASRLTTSVNADLSISQQQNPGLLLSALVTVPNASSCPGLVVERPMYFNYHGVNSGSDVLGATTASTNSYFADIPTHAGSSSYVSSFLSILNPPTGSTASITAHYYAAGTLVGSQSIVVAAGTRGTLTPGSLALPAHVAAILTSDQPVVVERSIYRENMAEGVVGVVSSASTVMGVAALSNHWLFAEGYAAPARSQENLLLSNLTATATTATVTLEYQNGHHQTLTVPVAAYSQVTLDVNQANAHPTGTCDSTPCLPTQEVSADVTATSASLVVERQMFFAYAHTLSGVKLMAVGGADVVGATSASSDVNFAEGYTNTGYNEWVTLQNPTMSTETLTVTLHNEYARTYSQNVSVAAQSRSTVDITALVHQHLVQRGDDFRAYQVSMNVQSVGATLFVAERPMYFHLPHTSVIEGGTDVVGFAGNASPPSYICTELNTTLTNGHHIDFMTAGPDGNVWFADSSANQLGKITPAGVTTEYTIPTANSQPEGITVGPDDNLWFTELRGNKIGKITSTGVITEYTIPTASTDPYGITKGSDNNLWFVESNKNKIGKITLSGVITEYPVSSGALYSITAGPDNNLWFTDWYFNHIENITPAGVNTVYSSGISANSNIEYVTEGLDGNLWFTEYNTNMVGRITPAGVVTEFSAGSNANSGPDGITMGADGNLWYTENNSTKIGIMTTSGAVVTEVDLGVGTAPAAITSGADNNIWFSDTNTGKIGKCVVTP